MAACLQISSFLYIIFLYNKIYIVTLYYIPGWLSCSLVISNLQKLTHITWIICTKIEYINIFINTCIK